MAALHEIGTWEQTRITLRDANHEAYLAWKQLDRQVGDLLTRRQLTTVQSLGASLHARYSWCQLHSTNGLLKQLAAEADKALTDWLRLRDQYQAWVAQDTSYTHETVPTP